MSNIIKQLSEVTANQIAAGEVVQRPASVVKELMENSIDAGATAVIVGIREGGCALIQVIDDGSGMSHDDALTAFQRHATSKIVESKDLFSIGTFGFRGEALPSIASVAEVELRTCQQGADIGSLVEINGGHVTRHANIQASVGTQFTIKNLFFNVPARRKFLKKPDSESRAVIAEFKKIALSYPKLSFILHHNDKCAFNLPITNLRKRVADVVGRGVSDKLMEVYIDTPAIEIKGYIATPDAAKKSPEQYMFVNGRYFRSNYFNKAVSAAYENLLPSSDVAPQYFLYFKCDPSKVDVNVHPAKTEVKFEDETEIYHILNAAVRASLGKNGIMPMIDFDSSMSIDIPIFSDNGVLIKSDDNRIYNPNDKDFSFTTALFGGSKDGLEPVTDLDEGEELELSIIQERLFNNDSSEVLVSSFEREGEVILTSSFDMPDIVSVEVPATNHKRDVTAVEIHTFEDFLDNSSSYSQDGDIELQTDSADDEGETFGSSAFEVEHTASEVVPPITDLFGLNDGDIPTGEVSKLGDKYILTSIGEDVYVIDIKRALSRIIFDRYAQKMSKVEANFTVMSQRLIFPATISLQVSDRLLVEDCTEDLASMGFLIEMGEQAGTVDVVGIPIDMSDSDPYTLFENVLDTLRSDDNMGYNMDKRQRLIMTLSSIATNQKFSHTAKEDMRYIVDSLRQCDDFSYTPSGKTIAAKIKMSEIKKLF